MHIVTHSNILAFPSEDSVMLANQISDLRVSSLPKAPGEISFLVGKLPPLVKSMKG